MATVLARPAQQRLHGQILERVQRLTSRLAVDGGEKHSFHRYPETS